MIGMLVLLMNLADLKNSNLISGSIICQAAERQSENTETENNSGGTRERKDNADGSQYGIGYP